MVINKISKALEGGFSIGANVLDFANKLKGVPLVLIKEANKFIKRNSLIVLRERKERNVPSHVCCEYCLGAHLVKKAEIMGYSKDVKNAILNAFDTIGHNGYYLDKERVVTI